MNNQGNSGETGSAGYLRLSAAQAQARCRQLEPRMRFFRRVMSVGGIIWLAMIALTMLALSMEPALKLHLGFTIAIAVGLLIPAVGFIGYSITTDAHNDVAELSAFNYRKAAKYARESGRVAALLQVWREQERLADPQQPLVLRGRDLTQLHEVWFEDRECNPDWDETRQREAAKAELHDAVEPATPGKPAKA